MLSSNTQQTHSDVNWIVACGGSEPVMHIQGQRIQYMWNTVTKAHAYYNLTTDTFLTPSELVRFNLA